MATYVSDPDSDAARIGLYNDGYMGSDSDLGTYSNRAAQTAWMEKQMEHTYYGGEFSGNLDWAKKYDTYLPENAIPEMYRTHLSYINSNIYQQNMMWKMATTLPIMVRLFFSLFGIISAIGL